MLDMRDVFELEPTTEISTDNSYIVSYPYLLNHFAAKPALCPEDVVCGAHMVYGWMPTILELGPESVHADLGGAAELLSKARKQGSLTDNELGRLAKLVNNSLVGASKLLHFVAPNHFPIWDSKIYGFVFNETPHNYRVKKIQQYRKYQHILAELQRDQRFGPFHQSVNAKVGYKVSALRALELVMFLNSSVFVD
jgi:hypothetical protein